MAVSSGLTVKFVGIIQSQKYQTFEKTVFERIVKLGYNNHSYNSLPVIMNRKLLSLGLIPHILGYEFTG